MTCDASTSISPTWLARPERGRGEQGGEHRGGTGPRVRCSPLAVSRRACRAPSWWLDADSASPATTAGCAGSVVQERAAACAAREPPPACPEDQGRNRGVSDHPFAPLAVPTPRPAGWSLTPRLPVASTSVAARFAGGHHRDIVAASCRVSAAPSAEEPATEPLVLSRCRRPGCPSSNRVCEASNWSAES